MLRVTLIVLALPFLASAAVQREAEEYPVISEITRPIEDESSILDDVRLHGGLTFISSFQEFALTESRRERGGVRGFALNFGIDLFSPRWIAQGVLVSYPESTVGEAKISSNGFELRLLYDAPIREAVTVYFGGGLANRAFNIKANQTSEHQAVDRSFQSGATVLAAGLEYWPSGSLSAGLELSNHIPMANAEEPSSVDLGIKLSGHF